MKTGVCGQRGKISYSRSNALQAIRDLRVKGNDDKSDTLNAYRCSLCGRWHVGHNKYAEKTS